MAVLRVCDNPYKINLYGKNATMRKGRGWVKIPKKAAPFVNDAFPFYLVLFKCLGPRYLRIPRLLLLCFPLFLRLLPSVNCHF